MLKGELLLFGKLAQAIADSSSLAGRDRYVNVLLDLSKDGHRFEVTGGVSLQHLRRELFPDETMSYDEHSYPSGRHSAL
jgi:hypothetical protein